MWKNVKWIHLGQDRLHWRGYSKHGNVLSDSIKVKSLLSNWATNSFWGEVLFYVVLRYGMQSYQHFRHRRNVMHRCASQRWTAPLTSGTIHGPDGFSFLSVLSIRDTQKHETLLHSLLGTCFNLWVCCIQSSLLCYTLSKGFWFCLDH